MNVPSESERRRSHRLLQRLLDLPAEERPAALEASGEEEAVRGTALRLLRSLEESEDVVAPGDARSRRLWTGLASRVAERETPLGEGAVLGPYRILREIERGGMAVVYRAERVDGEFTREVAVKILKLGLDTEEVVRRFEQERQILADLDHPNIARMFDGGRTQDGRPYFVMELVEGVPIDRYCDEKRLSVDERLELFCVVARAVESAHQNLVVHRDLKPSNILVNGAGQVKLLDFGIARLLDVETAGGAVAAPTRAAVRMMTPEYASPEQVRGERVTTASDVYQLGLLLYELLSGYRPYALSDPGSGTLERAICEQTPTRPSAAVGRPKTLKRPTSVSAGADHQTADEQPQQVHPGETRGATVEAICRARRTTPVRLRRRLRGDLDNITLKALRKAPERRYGTADRLVLDIRRHLDGLPVTARADTWGYRGRKFLQRHTAGTSAAAAVLVLAAGFAGLYTVRVQSERDRAQAEAAKAQQMNQFLTGLFRSADPREAKGIELTAGELLERGVEQVDRELERQPEVQADMLQVLGRTYMELGAYDSAERLLTRALDLRRQRQEPDHPDVARALLNLGELRYDQGLYERAVEHLQEAAHVFQARPDNEAPELADVFNILGSCYKRLGEYEKSLVAYGRALAIQQRAAGKDSEPVAKIVGNMGTLLMDVGAYERAEHFFEQAVAIYERELGPDHPSVATVSMNLANLRADQGKLEGVEEMYRHVLTIQEKVYGPRHAEVALALNNLGDFLYKTGRNDEAVDVLERALEVYGAAVRPDHPDTAYPLAGLGDAHMAAGRLREARRYFERSVAVRKPLFAEPRFDPVMVHSLTRLGRVERELGDEEAAERSLNRALTLWHHAPDAVHTALTVAALDLGHWLAEQGRCAEARSLLRRLQPDRRPPEAPWSSELADLETRLTECTPPSPDSRATATATSSP